MVKLGRRAAFAVALAFTGVAASGPSKAQSQELKIGIKTEPSSLDPQFHTLNPNIQVAQHFFDALVLQDENLKTKPGLALSWKTVDDTTWEFKLRPNVKFHDGSDFTAEDVVFTYERVPKVPNSPGPYTIYTRSMKSFEIVDPLTLRIHTNGPAPLLPLDVAALPILSKKAMPGPAPEGKTSAELNAGNGLVGTGPFKFVEWQRGSRIVGERNDTYWGGKPAWSKVILRPLSNNTARVAALLSGDVDLIEDPPTTDLAKLKNDPKIHLDRAGVEPRDLHPSRPARRAVGRHSRHQRQEPAARQAGARGAVDRDRPQGHRRQDHGRRRRAGRRPAALPDGRHAQGHAGRRRTIRPRPRSCWPRRAIPTASTITLGAPNGRYINDLKIAQAVASMWSRIGVKTEVDAAAPPVFFKNRDSFKYYSAYMAGWGASTGELQQRAEVAARPRPTAPRAWARPTRGRYSNKAMDAKLVRGAGHQSTTAKREALLAEASKMAMADHGMMPIHFELSVWAMKKGITYTGRADQTRWRSA